MKNYGHHFRNRYWGFNKVYIDGYTYIGGYERKDRNYWANWDMRMIPIRRNIQNISVPDEDFWFYVGIFLGCMGLLFMISIVLFCVYIILILL